MAGLVVFKRLSPLTLLLIVEMELPYKPIALSYVKLAVISAGAVGRHISVSIFPGSLTSYISSEEEFLVCLLIQLNPKNS